MSQPVGNTKTAVTSTHYRTVEVNGVEIFYREAGPATAPVVVLLHGFPSSSHMFRNLIPILAGGYHVIAPDYPAFGHSAVPDRSQFVYTFDSVAELLDAFLDKLGVRQYAIYVMDFGAPIGYRLALKNPDRVLAIVVQNGPAYHPSGVSAWWAPIASYWKDGSAEHRRAVREVLSLKTTRDQYLAGVRDATSIDPDNWTIDVALMERPGVDEIMLDMLYDIRNDEATFPALHKYFRDRQPPMLIAWGANDELFLEDSARAYLQDLPNAELHLLDTGHFALEEKCDQIAELMIAFLDRTLKRS
jgi:pimeloyl-ACP methyl ester carboxylesterase